jgi:hypothetical protein
MDVRKLYNFLSKRSRKEKGRDLGVDATVIVQGILRKHGGADGVDSTGAR